MKDTNKKVHEVNDINELPENLRASIAQEFDEKGVDIPSELRHLLVELCLQYYKEGARFAFDSMKTIATETEKGIFK